ncbi:TonB-dependent receptor plug domain-containing protein [Flavobacterium silvaticum]|uniref:TonB-dependent receptor n=1 Tax=Flavobacterium silvaticum TaxID=1852020 RepID=A0A972JGE7_9FLAO|nr:TonB-dependent receptor [Flavobacterium silvaticum]NMH28121.1 TonB-dependent receptor [Flavobacterium silvaticum]
MKKYLAVAAMLLQYAIVMAQQPVDKDSLDGEELEEVVIQSTRTSRTIKNTPTRVETIDAEELEEKANMKPANVSMVLHESTGIQVQQTSATSGNASIRIQGLDGRYSQLLKDSYPNFGNFASGLSILEIPPLDLKQVEVIKGPASTLYGGGAIAGVVNFISKTPGEKPETLVLLNQSHIGQTNFGMFSMAKRGKWGYSMLALGNLQQDYDVDKDGFSELPESKNATIHPRIFYYPNASNAFSVGNSLTFGESIGGDMTVIDHGASDGHTYFEKNNTVRNITTFEWSHKMENQGNVLLKQSLSLFDRKISMSDYVFSGLNTTSFTDLSYAIKKNKHAFITGANLIYDRLNQKENVSGNDLSSRTFTAGLYFQDTWDISDKFIAEAGLRGDFVQYATKVFQQNRFFALPRISVLYRMTPSLSMRAGGGLGYKVPTVFTEQTESLQYRNVLALSTSKAEQSVGGTLDFNFKKRLFEELSFSANQLFFYTSLSNPLVLEQQGDAYFFVSSDKNVRSTGFETNLKFIFHENYKLFAGYTFTDAKAGYLSGSQFLPLVPKNKVNLTLLYEKERNFKFGLEGYFTDKQYLYDATPTPSFWEFGFSAEKYLGDFSFYVNLENFTDERQSRYKSVVNGPATNPTFDDIWNHTEGFVFSAGLKYRL